MAKGQKTGGRVAGVPNKTSTEFRGVVTALLEKNAANVELWLSRVADGDPEHDIKPDPYKALDLLHKLAEYSFPKLARTELTGKDGEPVKFQQVTRRIVDPREPGA